VAEEIIFLSKDDDEARSYMGANGFIQVLVNILRFAMDACNTQAQETGALALFDIAVNNNRNRATILAASAVSLLLDLLDSETFEATMDVLLMLSSLEDNKASIGASEAMHSLIKLLDS